MSFNKFQRLLHQVWSEINSSYWFIPSLMSLLGILLSFLMVYIDNKISVEEINVFIWSFSLQPEGARIFLSTIASSMITVAGVTFSMTLLSVSHASSQIGPRILTGFMEDKGNQVTLGTFITTFLYSLLVLVNIKNQNSTEAEFFVPNFSILVAIILCLASILVLIYFINHVPKMISMTLAVERLGDNLLLGIYRIYPEEKEMDPKTVADIELPKDFETNSMKVSTDKKGYVKKIMYENLIKLAKDKGLILKSLVTPGDFVCTGFDVMEVYPQSKVNEEIKNTIHELITCGGQRTDREDLLFSVDLLIEVAARALSPGVNDPYTAVECINQLQAGLIELSHRAQGCKNYYDDDGELRLLSSPSSFEDLVIHIYERLGHYTRSDFIGSKGVFDSLVFLEEKITCSKKKEGLRHQQVELYNSCKQYLGKTEVISIFGNTFTASMN